VRSYRSFEEVFARLAELEAVVAAEPGIRVRHPGRHQAVLACACGRVLNSRDMVRIRTPHDTYAHETSTAIYPIGCRACAAEALGRKPIDTRPMPQSWSE